jgi:hypothetical protein
VGQAILGRGQIGYPLLLENSRQSGGIFSKNRPVRYPEPHGHSGLDIMGRGGFYMEKRKSHFNHETLMIFVQRYD